MWMKRKIIGALAALICLTLIFGGCGQPVKDGGENTSGSSNTSSGSNSPGRVENSPAAAPTPDISGIGVGDAGKIVISAKDVDAFTVGTEDAPLRAGMTGDEIVLAGYDFPVVGPDDMIDPGTERRMLIRRADITFSVVLCNDTNAPKAVRDCYISGFAMDGIVKGALDAVLSVGSLTDAKTPDGFKAHYKLPPQEDIIEIQDASSYTYRGSAETGSSLTFLFDTKLLRIEYVNKNP